MTDDKRVMKVNGKTPREIAAEFVSDYYFSGVVTANHLTLYENLVTPIENFIKVRFKSDDEMD